jgi:hypothetical protein
MPLPKIDQPLFSLVIPSTQKKVKYRPFTVKEEKILLIAQESKEEDQILDSVMQVIQNCVQDDINVEELAMFDLEYILVQLRSKSVSNLIEFKIDDNGSTYGLSMDLNEMSVDFQQNHSKNIIIGDNATLVMKYPTIKELWSYMKSNNDDTESLFKVLVSCVDMVVYNDEVYKMKDQTEKERMEFIESLSSKSMSDVKNFFETMPAVKHDIPYKTKDGEEKKFTLKGMDAFFI